MPICFENLRETGQPIPQTSSYTEMALLYFYVGNIRTLVYVDICLDRIKYLIAQKNYFNMSHVAKSLGNFIYTKVVRFGLMLRAQCYGCLFNILA